MKTSVDYSPWSLLPAPEPCTISPPPNYFYEEVAKHLIKDTVRLMANGLPIDLQKVQELEATLDETLSKVQQSLASNPIVRQYLSERYSRLTKEYIADQQSKMKPPDHFFKPFSHKNMDHRSYFMYLFIQGKDINPPDELLPSGIPKWSANDVKKLSGTYVILKKLLDGTISPSNLFVQQAMQLIAQHKSEIYNRKYEDNIRTLAGVEYPDFSHASPDQKHELLTGILGYHSEKLTDTYIKYERELNSHIKYGRPSHEPAQPKNKYSWDRDNIEALLPLAKSEDETRLFQALVDYSMGAIIKNNFIQAFYKYTVDGRLYGDYVLLGAKSGRYTSKNP